VSCFQTSYAFRELGGQKVAYPSPKAADRRRHPRVMISGQAQVTFQGTTVFAGLCDASRNGARLQITTERLDFQPNDRVIIQPLNGRSSIAFLCEVRHISVVEEQPFATKVYSVGLEQVARERNQADLLHLLLVTGTATLAAEENLEQHELADDRGGVVIKSLRSSIRESSRSRIFTPKHNPPELEEIQPGQNLDEIACWKVAIGIQSTAVSIEFNTYYSLPSARSFFRIKKNSPELAVEDHLVHDFMREFCNLTAGAIKIWVEKHAGSVHWEKDLRVQLPKQSQGEDIERSNSYQPVLQGAIQVQDSWLLRVPNGDHLICIAEIVVRDWSAVVTLQTDADNAAAEQTNAPAVPASEEDIDFL